MASFGRVGADRKPTLVCIGTIGSVGHATKSKTEGSPYYMNEVQIRPAAQGVKSKVRVMYDPAWFSAVFAGTGFKAAMSAWQREHAKEDGKLASTFVFEKNISGKTVNDQALLEGLCGSAEPWDALQGALNGRNEPLTPVEADDAIVTALTGEDVAGIPFFYVLKQEKRDGALGEYYEVAEVRWLSDKNLKGFVKDAERISKSIAGGKDYAPYEFKFDPSDFGLSVELPSNEPEWVNA